MTSNKHSADGKVPENGLSSLDKVSDTICEVGYVLVNGAKIMSINSESTELDDIKKTISDVGLDGVENINYLQAIKRVIGWIDKTLAN